MTQQFKRHAPVRGKAPGVAAIDVDGARYCIDCAADVLEGQDISYEKGTGEWVSETDVTGQDIADRLVSGDIFTLGAGGVVLKYGVNNGDSHHCACGGDCQHAVAGDDHDYDHDEPVGGRLKV